MYMYNTVSLYYGDEKLGDVEIYPPKELHLQQKQYEEEETVMKKKKIMEELSFKKEIRINQFSQPSERCPPLAVLHTVARSGLCFKLETKSKSSLLAGDTQLHHLHASCISDNKTAVMLHGEEELHLVALYSRSNGNQYPCFWAFNVPSGLYDSCLVMLNLRCLGIVFDLDETLVVANTMRSFEDRIEGLQRRLSNEVDPQRIGVMVAELKRYQEDKSILKQYVEADQVLENGKLMKAQSEVVPALSVNHQSIVRPLIRLQEKNIILTRINPSIRDTSVLVRLRPAWEELQSYLTARGRKRFEVYVCTMAERDYALEMWRLLDPDSNLINANELLDRIVCVKSGSKKSLFHVFQDGTCHPKMALVIDDRLKVWDEKDQQRVHVVPAFAPYHDPQAEAAAIPVLCVARNVACNVRGGFFKDFDDGLLQSITGISYENDIEDIPCPPDVCNYLVLEDDVTALTGNRDPLSFDGMADAEVERRLKEAISVPPAVPFAMAANPDPRLGCPLPSAMASSSVSVPMRPTQPTVMPFPVMQYPQPASVIKPAVPCSNPEPSLQSSPVREEGEVPESELDPDTRRRLLILQHGQDVRDPPPADPPFPQRPPVQVSTTPRLQSRSGWFPVEDEMNPSQFHRAIPKEFSMGPEPIHMEKHRQPHPSFLPKVDSSVPSDRTLHEYQRLPKEPLLTEDQLRSRNDVSSYRSFYGDEAPLGRSSSRTRDPEFVSEQIVSTTETPAEVLHGIATKCGAKVEYRPALVASIDLQFSIEARFAGERIGEGVGRTRREAMHMAAEGSIQTLANMYMSRVNPDFGPANRDMDALANGNRFLGSTYFSGNQLFGGEEAAHQLDPARPMETRLEVSKRSTNSISALNELCAVEGLGLVFQPHHPPPIDSAQTPEVHVQVEIDGQFFGKGIGSTWNEARIQAAERALGTLRPMLAQSSHKRQESPRSMHEASSKRQKLEPRVLQRVPSAGRYPNSPPIP